jgi:hypothetical protein
MSSLTPKQYDDSFVVALFVWKVCSEFPADVEIVERGHGRCSPVYPTHDDIEVEIVWRVNLTLPYI